jgi:Nucleotide modification associated domain 2
MERYRGWYIGLLPKCHTRLGDKLETIVIIRTYTLDENTNFAPHVSDGLLSLANCVGLIRKFVAKHPNQNHWIAGLTPARMGTRLAYLASVTEIISREEYAKRHGLYDDKTRCGRCDAIYADAQAEPVYNPWHTPRVDEEPIERDHKSDRVLLSNKFFFFAGTYDYSETAPHGLELPPQFAALLKKGAHGYGIPVEMPDDFLLWIERQPRLTQLDTIYDFERQRR